MLFYVWALSSLYRKGVVIVYIYIYIYHLPLERFLPSGFYQNPMEIFENILLIQPSSMTFNHFLSATAAGYTTRNMYIVSAENMLY